MNPFELTTPVAFLVFNRPDTTARVFAAIRQARPAHLLIIADGPRATHADDGARCAEVRRIVAGVDWPCQVEHDYADANLGCRRRVASGIDWVFSRVKEAIILEDDCLPDPSFFRFCQELLDRYRAELRVTSICGANHLGSWKDDTQSYHFSLYGGIWGWATWRRAWQFYDIDIPLWRDPQSRRRIHDVLGGGSLYHLRAAEFDRVAEGKVDTWDYQWSFAQLMQSGLTLTSAVNLVSNIGFNAEATHTVDPGNAFAAIPASVCRFPLQENPVLAADACYDAAMLEKALKDRPWMLKLSDYLRYLLSIIRRRGM